MICKVAVRPEQNGFFFLLSSGACAFFSLHLNIHFFFFINNHDLLSIFCEQSPVCVPTSLYITALLAAPRRLLPREWPQEDRRPGSCVLHSVAWAHSNSCLSITPGLNKKMSCNWLGSRDREVRARRFFFLPPSSIICAPAHARRRGAVEEDRIPRAATSPSASRWLIS